MFRTTLLILFSLLLVLAGCATKPAAELKEPLDPAGEAQDKRTLEQQGLQQVSSDGQAGTARAQASDQTSAQTTLKEDALLVDASNEDAGEVEDSVRSTSVTVGSETLNKGSSKVEQKKNKPVVNYIVREGESLWSIAARRSIYGDALLWPLLYQANRDQIKDPRQIFPGQELSIPRNKSEDELNEARAKARESTIFPLDILLKGR